MEEFRDIEGYEGLYQVSNLGTIRSYDKVIMRNVKGPFPVKGKVLAPRKHRQGYTKIGLVRDKFRSYFFIHRLVAIAHISNPESKPQVNHINGIKDDNQVDNLEWCTQSENMIHRRDILGIGF